MSTVKSHLIKSLVIAAVATAGILGGGSAFADAVAAPGGNESEETPIGVPVDDVTVEAPTATESDEAPAGVTVDDDAAPGGNESDETPINVPGDADAAGAGDESDPGGNESEETPINVPGDADAAADGNESDPTPIVVPTDDDVAPGRDNSGPAEDTLAETGPADLVGVAAAGSLLALGGLALGTLARRKRRAA